MSQAQRRMRRRSIPIIALYFALFFLVDWLFYQHRVHGPGIWLLAVLPAFPLIGAIFLLGQYLREETDEFNRAVITEAMLWGTGLTMALTTAWGFIEMFIPGVHVPLLWVFPAFCLSFAVSKLLVRRRFQRNTSCHSPWR